MNDDLCVAAHTRDPDRPRRAADGLYLCAGCLAHLERVLVELPELYHELGVAMASAGSAGSSRVSGTPERPLPLNPAMCDHRAHMGAVLASWAELVASERYVSPPGSVEMPRLAVWLVPHITWCAGHGWAGDMLAEVRGLAGRGWALLEPRRRLDIAERCRVVDEGGERCSGEISMVYGLDEWHALCSVCGRQEAAAYLRDGLAGRWVTVERVRAYAYRTYGVNVEGGTVRSWAARGHVRARGDLTRTWYDLASVDRYLVHRAAVSAAG